MNTGVFVSTVCSADAFMCSTVYIYICLWTRYNVVNMKVNVLGFASSAKIMQVTSIFPIATA